MKDRQDQGLQDSLGERTVLVIDDSEAVRTALDVLLSMHGARVLGAGSAAAAIGVLAGESVDLVIQDMNFRREATSGEEGIALFHQIRAHHPDLPVILLTGVDPSRDGRRTRESRRRRLRREALGQCAAPYDGAKPPRSAGGSRRESARSAAAAPQREPSSQRDSS